MPSPRNNALAISLLVRPSETNPKTRSSCSVKSLKAVSEPGEEYKDEAILKVKELFTRFNIGIWLGGGIGYETGEIRLAVEVNYRHGLNNIVDKDRRYDNPELQFAYYDVFDDIMVRNVELSLKVMLPLSFKAFRR